MSPELIGLLLGSFSLAIALLSAAFSYAQTKAANTGAALTQRDLTLTAYSNAIQSLLSLKGSFAEQPDIFNEQVRAAQIQHVIPQSMQGDERKFLLFASAFWKISYVYSITERWKELGLTEAERDALKAEMILWLTGLPGFYEVYESHISKLKVHNKRFLQFLSQEVYTEEFLLDQSKPVIDERQPANDILADLLREKTVEHKHNGVSVS